MTLRNDIRLSGTWYRGILLCILQAVSLAHGYITTSLVSVSTDGFEPATGVGWPSVSADGRFVAFDSSSSRLVAGDTNGATDVFVRDMQTRVTTRVSNGVDGTQANGGSGGPCISADGRYVAFQSNATNLVPGDTNGRQDVFVLDRFLGTIERVTVGYTGAQANDSSYGASLSADGRFVAFMSYASNIVEKDRNSSNDVFVRDRHLGTTSRVSVSDSGIQGRLWSRYSSISADGRYVAFESYAPNLVPDDTNGEYDVFVRDMVDQSITRASISSAGFPGNHRSMYPEISADGLNVAYYASASNLLDNNVSSTNTILLAQFSSEPRVFGRLKLLDFVGRLPNYALLEFREADTGIIVKSVDVSLSANGTFVLITPSAGTWALSVKTDHWLRRSVVIDSSSGDVTGVDLQLINGDVDGDNAVTVFDYGMLSDAFDSVEGDTSWNPNADLDGDGAVTVFDYTILSNNFDMVGDD